MLYNSNIPIEIMVDITTRCNAGCPQCHRTNINGLKKQSWLPNISWNLNTFKKAYPENVIKKTKLANFCGTWGDPIINNNVLDMVKYIRDINSDTNIHINTNGSIRNEEFWWNLGVAGDKRLGVVFAVEGIDQKMHEVYRQNTFLDKILNNMDILSNTNALVKSQTLIWKHNEDYLDEIENLCIEHGSIFHTVLASNRWEKTKELKFTKTDGTEEVLRKTDDTVPLPGRAREEVNEKRIILNEKGVVRKKRYMEYNDRKMIEKIREQKEVMEINCEWGKVNKINVNPDGQVLPCCYFGNPHFHNKHDPDKRQDFMNHPVIIDYKKHEKELNVFNNNLIDIMNHKWFQSTLQNSWKYTNPVWQCEKFCGKVHR